MASDKRKGLISGLKKAGPILKYTFIFAIVSLILSILFSSIQIKCGATRSGQSITHNKLDRMTEEWHGKLTIGNETKKSLDYRRTELSNARSILVGALEQISQGNLSYYGVIAGQLRALVCVDCNLDPLLLDLADENEIKLICYGFVLPFEENSTLWNGLKYLGTPSRYISDSSMSRPSVSRYDLKQWLTMPILFYKDQKYTPIEIIRMVAETEGGTEYSDRTPQKCVFR